MVSCSLVIIYSTFWDGGSGKVGLGGWVGVGWLGWGRVAIARG